MFRRARLEGARPGNRRALGEFVAFSRKAGALDRVVRPRDPGSRCPNARSGHHALVTTLAAGLDEPQTRDALAAYQRSARRLLGASAAISVALVIVFAATRWAVPSGDASQQTAAEQIASRLVVVPLLGMLAGALLEVRVARMRRLLSHHPWVTRSYRISVSHAANRRPSLLLDHDTPQRTIMVVSTFVWRWPELTGDDGEIRCAGDVRRRVVLMSRSRSLFVARRPITRAWRAYLMRKFQ